MQQNILFELQHPGSVKVLRMPALFLVSGLRRKPLNIINKVVLVFY